MSRGEPVIPTLADLDPLRPRLPAIASAHDARTDRGRRAERLLRGRVAARGRRGAGGRRHRRRCSAAWTADGPGRAGDYDHVVATKDHHVDPGAHWSDEPDFATPGRCTAGSAPTARRSTPTSTRSRSTRSSSRASTRRRTPASRASTVDGARLADWLRAHEVTTVDVCGIATDYCVRPPRSTRSPPGSRPGCSPTCAPASPRSPPTSALAEMRAAGVVRCLTTLQSHSPTACSG